MTKQTEFSLLVAAVEGILALGLGAPVLVGILMTGLSFVAVMLLFLLESSGKLWKE